MREDTCKFRELIERSIKNLDKDVGIAFSGGIDSLVLAKFLLDSGFNVTGYVAGIKDCYDIRQARKAADKIGLKLKVIELGEKDIEDAIGVQGRIIKKVYGLIELPGKETNDRLTCNAIPISFNLPLYFVAKHSCEKAIIVSQGPDEMIGGYKRYMQLGAREAEEKMEQDLKILEYGVMQNIETGKYFGKKFIMPYLTKEIIDFCTSLPFEMKICGDIRKYILRKLALEIGIPEEIAFQEKKACQYGSGIMNIMRKIARMKGHHVSWLVNEKVRG